MLSYAEMFVLTAAANGLGVKQTARLGGRSQDTIKTQRKRLLAKLEARNMTHAVAIAFRQGLLR